MDYLNLVDQLISGGYLKTPLIIEAFQNINRADFLPDDLKEEAGVNAPIPIGFGQTNSQPLTVAFMLELLQPQPGEKILDIGAGSGWTSALLAWCVSSFAVIPTPQNAGEESPSLSGRRTPAYAGDSSPDLCRGQNDEKQSKVFAIERIPELCEFGKTNVVKYNFITKGLVEFICVDGTKGLPEQAPFDKIIAAAAAEETPPAWKEQLKVGGRIVLPIESSIWLLIKKSEKEFEEKEFFGFAFVPLISD